MMMQLAVSCPFSSAFFLCSHDDGIVSLAMCELSFSSQESVDAHAVCSQVTQSP